MERYGERYEGFRRRSFAPVSVGEELDVKIEAVGEKGDGICKKKGFVLFVPSTKEGDEVRVKVTRVLKKVGFAEVVGEPQGPVEVDEKLEKKKKPAEEDFVPEGEASEDFGEEEQAEVEPTEQADEEKSEEVEESEESLDEPPKPE